jgi:hypothetical protein
MAIRFVESPPQETAMSEELVRKHFCENCPGENYLDCYKHTHTHDKICTGGEGCYVWDDEFIAAAARAFVAEENSGYHDVDEFYPPDKPDEEKCGTCGGSGEKP